MFLLSCGHVLVTRSLRPWATLRQPHVVHQKYAAACDVASRYRSGADLLGCRRANRRRCRGSGAMTCRRRRSDGVGARCVTLEPPRRPYRWSSGMRLNSTARFGGAGRWPRWRRAASGRATSADRRRGPRDFARQRPASSRRPAVELTAAGTRRAVPRPRDALIGKAEWGEQAERAADGLEQSHEQSAFGGRSGRDSRR